MPRACCCCSGSTRWALPPALRRKTARKQSKPTARVQNGTTQCSPFNQRQQNGKQRENGHNAGQRSTTRHPKRASNAITITVKPQWGCRWYGDILTPDTAMPLPSNRGLIIYFVILSPYRRAPPPLYWLLHTQVCRRRAAVARKTKRRLNIIVRSIIPRLRYERRSPLHTLLRYITPLPPRAIRLPLLRHAFV